jgi:DNA modification methylase
LGKNPSDFWDRSDDALAEVVWDSNLPDFSQTVWSIPNVKSNHVEKTDHPCQFPIGLVQRLIKALTNEADWVLDPFLGSGTTACAAILEGRKALGSELKSEYCKIAVSRVKKAWRGALPIRPFDKPIYVPTPGSKLTKRED